MVSFALPGPASRATNRPADVRIATPFLFPGQAAVGAVLLALSVLFMPPVARADEAAAMAAHRVVILNGADPYLPAFLALDRGARSAILERTAAPVIFLAETLDMFRFPQSQIEAEVLALLRKKYRNLKVDVVVAAGRAAVLFAVQHRSEIWPAATIVFHSVPEADLREMTLDARTIGVPVRIEFDTTLDLALRLKPATRRIAVVAGTADTDARHLELAGQALRNVAPTLEVQHLAGLTLADTVAAVRALPADTAVLYLTMFRDASGSPLVPRDVLTKLAAASPAPLFGIFETYLGEGIAAGSITSYEAQGRRAGELAARLLAGEDPAAIGKQQAVAPGCIADWRQLRRWGVAEHQLPADCAIRNREITAWDRYRWPILAALVVFAAQATLIGALLWNRRRLSQARTMARDEFGRRAAAESVADRLRDRLARLGKERSLGAMATAIAHEINQPLIAIQNYAQAAKRRVEGEVADKPKLMELFAKIERQAQRAGAITQRVRSLVSTNDVTLVPAALAPLLDEVVGLVEPEAEGRACRIERGPVADLPPVLVDALQIQIVLVNLLRNAMDSVGSGRGHDRCVTVDAQRHGAAMVQVSVADRGPGIPADRAEAIFEPLYSGTRGGMGLGLAIARTIVESHGGNLWHEPHSEGGAIFRFTLRAAGA